MATAPDPKEELVNVFESEQESEVMMVKGLLESAGIEAITQNLDFPQDLFPIGGERLLVRAEDAEEARQLIEEYQASGGEAADQAEAEGEASEGKPE